eukprot:Polyplicarium_translucidae@DN2191_c0_g1_i1.p1
MEVTVIKTKPYEGQKPGTSGLRKKVAVIRQANYLENFIQCIFDSLPKDHVQGSTLLVSGDGRYYNREAIQICCSIAAANGVRRVWVGKGGLMSTPAASCVIRERENGIALGGILLTASHNPGGPENDFGVKYNTGNGGPAPESLTDAIYELTTKISEYKMAKLNKIDIDTIGVYDIIPGKFSVEVIDPIDDWLTLAKGIFDFQSIQKLIKRPDFTMVYDGLHGVAGPYAKKLFVEELRAKPECLLNCESKEDFGGGHPDPNLTYAKDLVRIMKPNCDHVPDNTPMFGAAGDGDNDRNMILGRGFFVTPSDSVAVIAAYAQQCIPYFRGGLKGLARSMPTSMALDSVAKKLNVPIYEVPTGWKFFGNLMDAGKLSICGEESFGTGSDHIREKDGLWAVLAWLSILAHRNPNPTAEFVHVKQIVEEFWTQYGRNRYCRYDYEEVDVTAAKKLMDRLLEMGVPEKTPGREVVKRDNFSYVDPVDHTETKNQGIRFMFADSSRVVWRLSGTGSVGATIRIYFETTSLEAKDLDSLIEYAVKLCQIKEITGRGSPTVIT